MQKVPNPLLKAVTKGGKNDVAKLLKKRDIVIDERDTGMYYDSLVGIYIRYDHHIRPSMPHGNRF